MATLLIFVRNLKPGTPLPFLQLEVNDCGVNLRAAKQNLNPEFDSGPFPIDIISYGVQVCLLAKKYIWQPKIEMFFRTSCIPVFLP